MNIHEMGKKASAKHVLVYIVLAVLLILVGMGIGHMMSPRQEKPAFTGYAANPALENMVRSAVWQMSAEAHALILQIFYVAEQNVDEMIRLANGNLQGYHWVEEDGRKKTVS